ncbi:MAG: YjbQ family protein [Lentisphaerae bacterium]|jgi:secondary thiamine-phosphate synthase enzyme|nr:YjbQ family protein [Lentisphaerota bacterium]
MADFSLETHERNVVVDITRQVNALIPASLRSGVCHVFCPHTTAGLTVNENADPAVKRDLMAKLTALIPRNESFYRHDEGNSDAHLKASLVGMSLTLPVRDGRLALGTWQGVYFCEFDGPRSRHVQVCWQAAEF